MERRRRRRRKREEEEEGVTKMLRGPYSHSHGAQRAVIKLPLSNRLTMDPRT